MVTIEIDNIKYYYKNEFDDLTLEDFFRLQSILNRKEYDNEGKLVIEQTESFKNKKLLDRAVVLSNIPIEYLIEDMICILSSYDSIELTRFNSDRFSKKSTSILTMEFKGCDEMSTLQFFDFESAISMAISEGRNDIFLLAISIRLQNPLEYKSDTAHIYYEDLLQLNALDYYKTIEYYLQIEPDSFREQFYYIYKYTPTNKSNRQISSHTTRFYSRHSWEKSLYDLASTGYWNSSKGTLNATKYAPIMETIQVLNVIKGEAICESEDFNLNNKPLKK